jgi:hypothetical protein
MNEKLRAYVENLFAGAPKTKKAFELKEEFYANLSEKYRDLVASGKSEDEAYHTVISGIGDVEELIKSLEETQVFSPLQDKKERQKTATILSISVVLYFIAFIVLVYGAAKGYDPVGAFCLTVLIAAIPTGLLVYHFTSRPKYKRSDESMVEEFKEFSAKNSKQASVQRAISSCVWAITVPLYLIISFTFHNWGTSWIIFLVAVAIDKIIKAVLSLRENP